MDHAVFQTLSDTLSDDPNARMAAELRLRELLSMPEYPLSLCKLTLARECNISQRHSAVVLLKSYIDQQWSHKSPKFRGPEPSSEVRGVGVTLYFTTHLDWPDSWPELFDILLAHLKTGSADEVHGSMRVLAEFVSKDVTHLQLPKITPVLLPELLRILVSEQEHSEAVREYLSPIFSQWNDAFIAILNKRTTDDPEIEVAEWGLKVDIIKCINLSIQGFPKLTSSYILPVLSSVWQEILYLRPRYVSENIATNGDISGFCFQDSDGDNIGFESLLLVQFEFIQIACRRRKLTQSVFMGRDGHPGILEELVWNALSYMQMTDDQAETWNADPNQFIADEDADSFTHHVRNAAQDVLATLVELYESQTILALNQSIHRNISTSMADKASGKDYWWKAQESSLLAVGLMTSYLCESIKRGTPSPIDVGALFDHLVLANLSEQNLPFLQGRSFVLASQFAPILPLNLAVQYVSAAVEAILKAPSAVVKVSALKALNNFNRHLDKQYIAPYQRSIIQGVAPLVQITSEETLILIFRTLTTTAKVDDQVAAEFESILGPIALDSWAKYHSDACMSGETMNFFDTLAANPYMNQFLSNRALPNGQECLKILIQKDVRQIAEWRDAASGKSGTDLLIQFIAKLLDPSQSESAALFVGDLVAKLIGDPYTPGSSEGCHHPPRRRKATFFHPVINFLDTVDVRGQNGLHIVLTAWLLNHADFQGLYHQKVSAIALTKVFTSGDPRVAVIQVKGDMILTESSRRTTRSTARKAPNQYAVVSAPVKIVKLLCADLITRIEEETHSGEFDDDESEEDEDEDEEESETEDLKDWEGSKNHDRSVLLSDVLGDDGKEYYGEAEDGDELEEVDPDVLADPVYQTNLKKFLVDFFCSQLHSPGLVHCINELNDAEKQTLSCLLKN
ncbi:Importin 9 [Linnemannia gamsii]|uniref:Importin 9 n=1 Tax=Linnemannia gamsii TaxID=64522 RepID=A0A9P6RJN3_9FUNG|nr:Importin 9 [Linnemannia gamsii]